jgi:hypothetical protein
MSQAAKWNPFIRTLAIIFLVFLLFLLTISFVSESQAQDAPVDFGHFLQDLNVRMSNQEGFLVTFQFQTPLIDDEDVWTLGGQENTTLRVISEIGNDYLCFQETAGGVRFVRCTAFDNIISVSYIQD